MSDVGTSLVRWASFIEGPYQCSASSKYLETKLKTFTDVPLEKTLNESNFNNPVIPKLLDSTRLGEPGGGNSSGRAVKPQFKRQELLLKGTYAAVASRGKSMPRIVEPLLTLDTSTLPPADDIPWKIVVRKKNEKQHFPLTHAAFNEPRERYGLPLRNPEQVKRNPTTQNQYGQETFRKKTRRKKHRVGPPSEPHSPMAGSSVGVTPEPQSDDIFFGILQQTNSDNLETWWRILGFEKTWRGSIRVAKYIKALEAVGFTRRNGDGSQVTFNPPIKFERSRQGLRLPPITLHIPHSASIEDVELRDKRKSIKENYPIL
ncbi:unnamed protein product, partial [Rhizoctonia solani]